MTTHDNSTGRLLAVGDIHGCLEKLCTLMERVAPQSDDQVVFLGDYIDRGPDSCGVVDYLLDFAERFPRTVFLKGNHEAMLLDFISGRDHLAFLANGGRSTLESYALRSGDTLPPTHLAFFRALKLYHETREFIFVHAGLRPGRPLSQQREEDLLWIREEFLDNDYDWGKTVVFGHTPQSKGPLKKPGRLGLDTGAVYGRALTCCEVRSGRCWSVPEREPKKRQFFFF
ncbi:MAG: metallophosphoesterase family protein [Geoalkalibacter sp.]|jgi:serine/threonine protein phosphatase 1|uniref:metallophosphoesterase family protein n=1 Tax=Geoalkalibacter sp. TaxID=3041440 RepID=UPI002A9E2659|nr:metallophosphoesterase family protein [Thermodesulfobacteriota bacterium]